MGTETYLQSTPSLIANTGLACHRYNPATGHYAEGWTVFHLASGYGIPTPQNCRISTKENGRLLIERLSPLFDWTEKRLSFSKAKKRQFRQLITGFFTEYEGSLLPECAGHPVETDHIKEQKCSLATSQKEQCQRTSKERNTNHMDSNTEKNHTFRMTWTPITSEVLFDQVTKSITHEMAYWTSLLTSVPQGPATMAMHKKVKECLEGLERESSVTNDIAKAIQAEQHGLHADACVYYMRAHSDLHFALSSWSFATPKLADDSPLDHYMATTVERAEQKKQGKEVALPTRTSYADLLNISTMLHHVYLSLERIHAIGLFLTRYQMAHLTAYLSEAEQQG